MALSEFDRNLIQRCLAHESRAWEDFVNRFLGLVVHVVNHTSQSRSIRLASQDAEDLVSEVFVTIIANDYALLRRFRGQSSLATYLTVVARRVAVRELLKRKITTRLDEAGSLSSERFEERIHDRDQVERLLEGLSHSEADVVRLYHLEGKSYHEISAQTGMPENSVGPTLSRARAKMRRAGAGTE